MLDWWATKYVTDAGLPVAAAAFLDCARNSTTALARTMPARLEIDGWPLDGRPGQALPAKAELRVLAPQWPLCTFALERKRGEWFGANRGVLRYEFRVRTNFPDRLFSDDPGLARAWEPLQRWNDGPALHRACGQLFAHSLSRGIAQEIAEAAQRVTAAFPAAMGASLRKENWPKTGATLPAGAELIVAGKGLPLAWISLRRLSNTQHLVRAEFYPALDVLGPPDAPARSDWRRIERWASPDLG